MRAPIPTFKRARALRREMSLPEVVLWQALRGKRLRSLRFRRQHPIGPYVLDFYCPSARLAVEVDGAAHDIAEQVRHDERRSAWLAHQDVKVIRFMAADILKDERLEGVLLAIAQAAAPSTACGGPAARGGTGERGGSDAPPLSGGGTGERGAPDAPPRSGGAVGEAD